MSENKIKVKLISRTREIEWRRYFRGDRREWGNCRYSFTPDERNYDWLVVCNDFPNKGNERFPRNEEVLACPAENTLLVTTEPSNIKTYGKAFTDQFGHVLTSQEAWALPHRNRIFSQPALRWFYGVGSEHIKNWHQLHDAGPNKSRLLSTVYGSKLHMTKLHVRRNRFIEKLKSKVPELDLYGRGVRPINDKAEALDDYFYHLAVENYIGKHHWTEKIADCFLGWALPLYAGCSNITDYFPAESLVPINIFREEEAIEKIIKVIHDNEYQERLPAIMEARRRVLEEYNFFAVLSGIIEERHQPGNAAKVVIRSRRAILSHSPLAAIRQLLFKTYVRTRHWYSNPGI